MFLPYPNMLNIYCTYIINQVLKKSTYLISLESTIEFVDLGGTTTLGINLPSSENM